jgi:hypothetical protein
MTQRHRRRHGSGGENEDAYPTLESTPRPAYSPSLKQVLRYKEMGELLRTRLFPPHTLQTVPISPILRSNSAAKYAATYRIMMNGFVPRYGLPLPSVCHPHASKRIL